MVVRKFQGLGPNTGGTLVQAGPAGVLRPRLTALVFCDQREAPALVSELREGHAETQREGSQDSSAVPSPVPTDLSIPEPYLFP